MRLGRGGQQRAVDAAQLRVRRVDDLVLFERLVLELHRARRKLARILRRKLEAELRNVGEDVEVAAEDYVAAHLSYAVELE